MEAKQRAMLEKKKKKKPGPLLFVLYQFASREWEKQWKKFELNFSHVAKNVDYRHRVHQHLYPW